MVTVWDKYWQENKFDDDLIINNLKNSYFWKQLKENITKHFGSFKSLRIIELGAGRGEMSLLMAQEGANITLIDESEYALKEAMKLYKKYNCKVNLLQRDIFNIKKGNFDIALSFGLAEHFKGEKRFEVFNKHYDLIKENGLIILSVPNSRCFPYQIYKFLTQLLRLWKYGIEISYSIKELEEISKRLDIKKYNIYKSSFLNAFYHFLIINPIKILGLNLKERFMDTRFLNNYGYALIFVGKK